MHFINLENVISHNFNQNHLLIYVKLCVLKSTTFQPVETIAFTFVDLIVLGSHLNTVTLLCRVMEQNYQLLLAMLFAIEEINRNSHLLPNTSLGIEVYNLPFSEMNVLQTVFNWFTGLSTFSPNYFCGIERKSAALLIGIRWKTSELIGTLLHLYKFPQVSESGVNVGQADLFPYILTVCKMSERCSLICIKEL